MKIKLTESQYKKVVLREFGETVTDPKEWYLNILSWVDSPNDLTFKSSNHEVVVFDQDGVYLGYYDKEQEFGFVVDEYGVDSVTDDELIDEQEEGAESSGGGLAQFGTYLLQEGPQIHWIIVLGQFHPTEDLQIH